MKIRNSQGYQTCLHSRKRKQAPWRVDNGCDNRARLFTGRHYELPNSTNGSWIERTVRCVRAADVAAVMGNAGWLVRELRCMETIRWGNDNTEYYIIYEKGNDK